MLMLLVLIGGSAWWLNFAAQSTSAGFASPYSLHSDHRAMMQARQSLLSYASLYHYLYGPSGSGPGHLPCPDTDHLASSSQARLFAGDSPDPPCGSSLRSSGRLPRHVTLPGNRYSFHSETHQRFNYSVYAHAVNNPLNRVVNPSLLASAQSANAIAATIDSDTAFPASASNRSSSIRITNSALMQAVKPAVAAWILDVVDRSELGACPMLIENNVAQRTQASPGVVRNSGSALLQRCQRLAELRHACAARADMGATSTSNVRPDHILLLLLDQLPDDDTCLSDELGDSTIERVSANRHWFIRNRWADWIHIESSPDCSAGLVECSLIYQPEKSTGERSPYSLKIVFQWQTII